MKQIFIYIFLIFISCQSCNSDQQNNSENKLTTNIDNSKTSKLLPHDDLTQFIPKGFRIFGEYSGDLNLDSLGDKLLILQVNDSLFDSTALSKIFPDTFNYEARPFLILLRQNDGFLKQVESNDKIIRPEYKHFEETDDPFDDLIVNRGLFRLSHSFRYGPGGLSIHFTDEFEYSKKDNDWFLKKTIESGQSDKQNDDGSWGEITVTKTAKDFGKIRFKNYKGVDYIP